MLRRPTRVTVTEDEKSLRYWGPVTGLVGCQCTQYCTVVGLYALVGAVPGIIHFNAGIIVMTWA